MNHFEYKDGALHCEGVALAEIAAAVGTPVYVYSSATLERHYRVFKEAFAPRDPLVAFAVKANGNIAVIATLAKLGAGADTVSAGEITRALKAGVPPSRIIFSGVGKTAEELAFALDASVYQINVESPAEIAMLGEIAAAKKARAPLAIRVNPAIGAGGHKKINTGASDSKFGVSRDVAAQLYAEAVAHPWLDPKGFAVHIGSQIKTLEPYRDTFAFMRKLAEDARAQGLPVERLDLGGGLAVPYFHEPEPPSPADYARVVTEALKGLDIEFAFEPGRMIAGNAGVLVSRVVRVQARAERPILVLDAGMNDLLRPALYEGYHDIRPVVEPARDATRAAYDVVGPICESGDTFTKRRELPALAAGDLVAFMTAGAYGATMSSVYNARALVPEVLVRGDKYAVVRRRWNIEDQLALETMPNWLAS